MRGLESPGIEHRGSGTLPVELAGHLPTPKELTQVFFSPHNSTSGYPEKQDTAPLYSRVTRFEGAAASEPCDDPNPSVHTASDRLINMQVFSQLHSGSAGNSRSIHCKVRRFA